ncbi:MAG TPA: dihydrolipoyl dehydrogenase [Acidobacteriota bacterium]|nr:dihydrolipoyl dehydrogenase [Acidobacteriota bacterium]
MEKFDLTVLGGGPGGYVAAIRAAQLGKKVALVEKKLPLGGTCLNVGCIPSKVLLESSDLYHKAEKEFSKHGITVTGASMSIEQLMARKNKVVKELTDGIMILVKKGNIHLMSGFGRIKAKGLVEVTGDGGIETVESQNILIAVGSEPVELPFLSFDGEKIVNSTDALSFDKVPGSMIVIGAGAIGLELGSVWKRLGSKVTFVEILPRVAPFADSQASKMLERALIAQGLEFKLETKVVSGEKTDSGVVLTVQDKSAGESKLEAEKVLVAVGRRPATRKQGLEEVGIQLDEKGRIKVDENFETTVPSVYAIGDCVEGAMLAHKASEEGVACVEKMAGLSSHVNYNAIPNVVYTEPELAQVGITDEEAKAKGVAVKTGKSYFKGNGRAKSLMAEDGFVKVVADAETDKLLGLHIVGPRASEMIHEGALCIEFEGTAEDMGIMCHAHPTLSESLKEAALAVHKKAIHG